MLHLHRGFRGRQYRPRCQPPLPEAELLEHPSLQHLVLDLAAHLEVRTHFMDNHEIDWSRATSSWPCVGFNSDTWGTSSEQTHEDGLNNNGKIRRCRLVSGYIVMRILISALIFAFMLTNVDFLRNVSNVLGFFWTQFRFYNVILVSLLLTRGYKSDFSVLFRNVAKTFSATYVFFFRVTVLKLTYFWTPFVTMLTHFHEVILT